MTSPIKQTLTKIIKSKQTTPFKKSAFDDENKNKTSTPIQEPSTLSPVSLSNKKKQAPILPPTESKKLYESRKQYMNPFDSDEDEDHGNPFATDLDKEIIHAPIIEIKQNGDIIDVLNDSQSFKKEDQKPNEIDDEIGDDYYRKRARQLIQQTKQSSTRITQKSNTYEDFNSLTSSSPSQTSSLSAAHKPETIQLAKQLIADARKRKLNICLI